MSYSVGLLPWSDESWTPEKRSTISCTYQVSCFGKTVLGTPPSVGAGTPPSRGGALARKVVGEALPSTEPLGEQLSGTNRANTLMGIGLSSASPQMRAASWNTARR